MPQHTDDKTNVTPPEPIPEPEDGGSNDNTQCTDTSNGALDSYGDSC